MFRIDHLVVTSPSLYAGAAHVADALGAMPQTGGRHVTMGTHNRLLSLGDCYLEVIAADPKAPPPGRPRWFALDDGPVKASLSNWVMQGDDLSTLAGAVPVLGPISDFARGDLRWQMMVPPDGHLPFAGGFPAPIRWLGETAASRLPDNGLRLRKLMIFHLDAQALRKALVRWLDDDRVLILDSSATRLEAVIDTPNGERTLT